MASVKRNSELTGPWNACVPHMLRRAVRGKHLATSLVVGLAALTFGLLVQQPSSAHAVAVAAQCNGEMNGGGTQVACTVTVVNYLTASGDLSATPPSTLTLTRCVGASGPLDTLTCTTTTSTSTEPVTTVQQCNGSGNGGGGTVICTVTVTNHFIGDPAEITAATVYQCVGSAITGPGAPGTCTPANTPGINSVTAATVGQCNGSGNGGSNVGFVCTVSAGSTTTATLTANVDQCNGSGNGGGALVRCQATVTNDVIPQVGTPTSTATATATGSATPTATATATGSPGGTATATVSGTPGQTATTTGSPGATATQTGTQPTRTVAPGPPATGTGPVAGGGSQPWLVIAGALIAGGVAAQVVRSRR